MRFLYSPFCTFLLGWLDYFWFDSRFAVFLIHSERSSPEYVQCNAPEYSVSILHKRHKHFFIFLIQECCFQRIKTIVKPIIENKNKNKNQTETKNKTVFGRRSPYCDCTDAIAIMSKSNKSIYDREQQKQKRTEMQCTAVRILLRE